MCNNSLIETKELVLTLSSGVRDMWCVNKLDLKEALCPRVKEETT